jgi:hypothetical protein
MSATNRASRRKLASKMRRLKKKVFADLSAMRAAMDAPQHHGKRRCVSASVIPLPAALNDPALGGHAMEALLAAYGSAHGLIDGVMCECSGCGSAWSPTRTPAEAVRIDYTRPDGTALGMLCGECASRPWGEVVPRLAEFGRGAFFGDGPVTVVPAMAPGGRA